MIVSFDRTLDLNINISLVLPRFSVVVGCILRTRARAFPVSHDTNFKMNSSKLRERPLNLLFPQKPKVLCMIQEILVVHGKG